MQNDQEEYLSAFRGDDAPMSEAPADESVSEDNKNAPDESGAVGTEESPAVAVVIDAENAVDGAAEEAGMPVAEEAAAEGEPVAEEQAEQGAGDTDDGELSPEEMQKQRSWEGRLRKREEELAAREAASQSAPEVDDEEIAALQAKLAEDFGDDFVQSIMKLAGYAAKKQAQGDFDSKLSPINEQIAQAIADVTKAFEDLHFGAIADAHEDFQEIVSSPEFAAFMDQLPDEKKAKAAQIMQNGRAPQVVALLTEYKGFLTANDKAGMAAEVDDVALDAAEGVRGSSPVSLPGLVPASGEDEYKAAWSQM